MDVTQKVIEILAAQALRDPADVRLEDTIASLGLDSLGVVEVIFALEEAFDIAIPFNANEPGKSGFDISSVGAIVAEVEGLLRQRAA
jgi:acyl carrier protein